MVGINEVSKYMGEQIKAWWVRKQGSGEGEDMELPVRREEEIMWERGYRKKNEVLPASPSEIYSVQLFLIQVLAQCSSAQPYGWYCETEPGPMASTMQLGHSFLERDC